MDIHGSLGLHAMLDAPVAAAAGFALAGGWRTTTPENSATGRKIIARGRARGVRFLPFGVGANDDAITYRLWAVWVRRNSEGQAVAWFLASICAGTFTVSSSITGPAHATLGAVSGETTYGCDTATVTMATSATTPAGPWTDMTTARTDAKDLPAVYSPGSNLGQCELYIPDLLDCDGVILECQSASGSKKFNSVYELTK
jgi:hypothetical protein